MNNNLPEIRRKGIFFKIKNWFKSLFNIQQNAQEIQEDENEIYKEINNYDFKKNLQEKSNDSIIILQRNLKEKQIEISELTDEELDKMILLYKKQIEEKKNKLRIYKEKFDSRKKVKK